MVVKLNYGVPVYTSLGQRALYKITTHNTGYFKSLQGANDVTTSLGYHFKSNHIKNNSAHMCISFIATPGKADM